MKIRITKTPCEHERDGVRLDAFVRGMVRDVSPLIGAWLTAEGYALPEMRETREEDEAFTRLTSPRRAPPRRRRGERRLAR